ncbi:MAG: tetratricopeptide repeat protein [Acidobacteriota bacterium]
MGAGFSSCNHLKRWRGRLLILCLASSGSFSEIRGPFRLLAQSGLPLEARYNQAIQQFQAGDYATACGTATSLVAENPDYFAVHNLLGLCQTQKGNLDSAAVHFRKSIRLNHKFVDARINLAVNRAQRGELQEGMQQFREVLRLDPANLNALFNLGKLELLAKRADNAVTHLLQASKLAPQDVSIRLSLAQAYLASGQMKEASPLVSSIVQERSPAPLKLSAAMIAFELGDEPLGRQGVQDALEKAPSLAAQVLALARQASQQEKYELSRDLLAAVEPALGSLAEWNALQGYNHYQLGDPEKALLQLQQALKLDPHNESYYLKIGELMLFHNSDQAAQAFFEAGLEVLPNSALLHYGLAVSCLDRNSNLRKLEEHVETALKLQPTFEPALKLLCVALRQQADWGRLHEAADRLIRMNSRSSSGYFYKAVALIGLGPLQDDEGYRQEVGPLLQQAVRLNPNDPEPRIALGKVLIGLDRTAEAIAELETATRLNPDSSEAHFQLARAYRKGDMTEKHAKAIDDFKRLKTAEQAKRSQGWKALFQVQN